MEAKNEKVLGNSSADLLSLKGKQAFRQLAVAGGSAPLDVSEPSVDSSTAKLAKRRKINGKQGKLAGYVCSGRALLCYYSNFTESGVPARPMIFQSGEWVDFPQDLVASIRDDLSAKKAVIQVEFEDRSYVLDFLHMFRLDVEIG